MKISIVPYLRIPLVVNFLIANYISSFSVITLLLESDSDVSKDLPVEESI